MRFSTICGCVLLLLSVPAAAAAQIYNVPTPRPAISAADRDWYIQRLPISFAGDLYYPAGPRYHFDPDIMVPAGTYDGVPLYVDTSVQPYSEVLVPVSGGLVQPYERPRTGVLAGTTGSHAPDFPVDIVPWEDQRQEQAWPARPAPTDRETSAAEQAARRRPRVAEEEEPAQPARRVESIPAPEGNLGIWIVYEGARWQISAKAVPFDAARFSKIGDYFGFPVYAMRGSEEIYIPAADDMLAVYGKR